MTSRRGLLRDARVPGGFEGNRKNTTPFGTVEEPDSKELVLNRIEALERIRDQAITDLSDTTKDALGLWNAALTVRTMEAAIQELRYFMAVCGL